MMREVSTRALGVWFGALEAKHIPPQRMVEHTGVPLALLRNPKERIDWADFVAIMKNLRPLFSDAEYIDVGRSYFRSRGMQYGFVIARELFTPMDFYRWINKPRGGGGNQMFTCIVPTHRELSETQLEVDLEVDEPHEVYWDFFIPTIGNFEEMPRLLGCPPAIVELERIPRGGRYHIAVPQRTPIVTRLRRAVTWPFTTRVAARELKDAHELLQERYHQLEDARGKLERQRALLDAAYRIGQRVFGLRDVQTIADRVAQDLVELGSSEDPRQAALVAGARVELDVAGLPVVATAGTTNDAHAEVVALPGQPSRGRISAWPPSADVGALLALLAPTLALAADNALAYAELDEYRRGLEELVEHRTAELRETSGQLAATVEQLRDAESARERLFSNISHEIRTPLSLILLATADVRARLGTALDERVRADLGAIHDSARKLLRLVDELLLLAAGDAGALAIRPEPVDIVAAITAIAATWRPAAEASGLALEVRTVERAAAVVDPVAFERVVSNLMSNAVKFTPRGGAVAISVTTDAAHVTVKVTDTGPGIDEAVRTRLFDRFARGSGRTGGSGIGLALVKQLVEAHGGNASVCENPVGGTIMAVVLPATTLSAATRVQPTMQPLDFGNDVREPTPPPIRLVRPPRGAATAERTVLVVDDDARLAARIAGVLGDEHTVLIAHDGASALALAETHQPHLLVTDVDMPGMDGLELARRFRQATRDKLAPIVILSAVVDLDARLAGLEAGAVDYVIKPFDPGELLARVRAQFRMRDLALRLHRAEQLSSLGTLAAGLAHELRNPANGIVNAVEPLRELLPPEILAPNTPTAALFGVIAECADQVAFLSTQLLGFRNKHGAIEMRVAAGDEIVDRAALFAAEGLRGVEVRIDAQGAGTVRCAPPLIVQVLANLLENAGHAAGPGGWVHLAARADAGKLAFEISDSGPGVPVELRERIFEPFFTTKPPGAGTGLGLALARDIIHRHGGVLELRTRGDGRLVFTVELPRPASGS